MQSPRTDMLVDYELRPQDVEDASIEAEAADLQQIPDRSFHIEDRLVERPVLIPDM